MVVREGPFSVAQRKLEAASKFCGFGFGREKFPSFEIVVPIKPPDPDVGVVEKVISEQGSEDTIRELEGIAGIDAVEPHKRPQHRRRAKIDLLKADPGLEARGGKPSPHPVQVDLPIGLSIFKRMDVGCSIGIQRHFEIQRKILRKRFFQSEFGNVPDSEEGFGDAVGVSREPSRDESFESGCQGKSRRLQEKKQRTQ